MQKKLPLHIKLTDKRIQFIFIENKMDFKTPRCSFEDHVKTTLTSFYDDKIRPKNNIIAYFILKQQCNIMS